MDEKKARDAGWAPGADGKWVHPDKADKKYDSAKDVVDGEKL